VEEAQRAINAAHVEAESIQNGVGLVKLMGRYSGGCLSLSNKICFFVEKPNSFKHSYPFEIRWQWGTPPGIKTNWWRFLVQDILLCMPLLQVVMW
jgi:hypothetical protein